MVEHTTTEKYQLDAWKGTPGDLADLFERVSELAVEADPALAGSISVTVKSKTGGSSFKDLSEFRAFGNAGKLFEAEEVVANFQKYDAGVSVFVLFNRDPWTLAGAHLSVSGNKALAVSGMRKQVAELLSKGKRHRPRLRWVYPGGILLAAFLFLSSALIRQHGSRGAGLAASGLAALVGIGVATSPFWLPLIVPNLEILDPTDPRSRYQRSRGKLLGAAWALFVASFAAIMGALAQTVL